jgi:hypothetical protein
MSCVGDAIWNPETKECEEPKDKEREMGKNGAESEEMVGEPREGL